MGHQITLPFDIQYMILTEIAGHRLSRVPKDEWDTIVSLFCVCRTWYATLRNLLVENSPANELVGTANGIGLYAMERAVADYTARESAKQLLKDKSDESPSHWTATVFTARRKERAPRGDALLSDLKQCLIYAAARGYVDCLRVGLKAGFEYVPSDLVTFGMPHIPVLEFLLDENYADVNEPVERTTALGGAVYYQHVPAVEFLLTRGADSNIRLDVFITDSEQESLSLVSYAAWVDNTQLMQILLTNGLGVEDPEYQYRPIWWAIYHNNLDMARLLIDNGAKLDPSYVCDDWPLLAAIRGGHGEMVILMLEKGGFPDDATWAVQLWYDAAVSQSEEVHTIFAALQGEDRLIAYT
ncbi:hypothetical protein BDV12DRAFT_210725 [Aspergillus spectabilis]